MYKMKKQKLVILALSFLCFKSNAMSSTDAVRMLLQTAVSGEFNTITTYDVQTTPSLRVLQNDGLLGLEDGRYEKTLVLRKKESAYPLVLNGSASSHEIVQSMEAFFGVPVTLSPLVVMDDHFNKTMQDKIMEKLIESNPQFSSGQAFLSWISPGGDSSSKQ
jgi:hypothetical protein